MTNIEVRSSPIHGKGVFACRDFKAGEIVIDWSTCSRILTDNEYGSLSEDEKRYVSKHEGKWILFSSPGKYVNHSCNPNTRAENGCDVAVRDIKKGEEITADYITEQVPVFFGECSCGAENCNF